MRSTTKYIIKSRRRDLLRLKTLFKLDRNTVKLSQTIVVSNSHLLVMFRYENILALHSFSLSSQCFHIYCCQLKVYFNPPEFVNNGKTKLRWIW